MTDRWVAVTGATGFLGMRLVPALARAGWRVRVLARRPQAADAWGEACPEVVVGDLADRDALDRLTDGAHAVIHAAGLIKARRRGDFFAANADGARAVAHAAPAGGMILISSLAAREPKLSDYAASKRAGEDAAREVLGDRLAVLRPPAIYGPGDRETLSLFRLAGASPVLPLFGGPGARLALAHVDDVTEAIVDLAAREVRPPLVTLPGARADGYGWADILAAAAEAMGRGQPRLLPIPRAVVMAAGAASEAAGVLFRKPAIFTRGKAREFLHPDWSATAADGADEAPPARFPLDQGFAQTIAWYREHGWLPTR